MERCPLTVGVSPFGRRTVGGRVGRVGVRARFPAGWPVRRCHREWHWAVGSTWRGSRPARPGWGPARRLVAIRLGSVVRAEPGTLARPRPCAHSTGQGWARWAVEGGAVGCEGSRPGPWLGCSAAASSSTDRVACDEGPPWEHWRPRDDRAAPTAARGASGLSEPTSGGPRVGAWTRSHQGKRGYGLPDERFFICGYLCRRQRSIASSSRSRARRSGFCELHPQPRKIFHTWAGW